MRIIETIIAFVVLKNMPANMEGFCWANHIITNTMQMLKIATTNVTDCVILSFSNAYIRLVAMIGVSGIYSVPHVFSV